MALCAEWHLPRGQHHTFYELIVTKARGKSGPLFHFDVHDDVRMMNDARVEKDEVRAAVPQPCQSLLRVLRLTHVRTYAVASGQDCGATLVRAQQAYLPRQSVGGGT